MITWFLIGWPAALALFIGLKARGPMMNDPAEDAAQAAYLAEWSAARLKYKNRQHAKDRRGQREALDRVQAALHAKMRAELGQ